MVEADPAIPQITFVPTDGSFPEVMPQWKDVSVSGDVEVTTKPSSAGGTTTFIRRSLPRQASGQFSIADNRPPGVAESFEMRTLDFLRRETARLETLKGKLVFFHCRATSFVGIVSSIKFDDSGEWDNALLGSFEVKEILEANPDGSPKGVGFGKIRIPFKPTNTVGGNAADCQNAGSRQVWNVVDFFAQPVSLLFGGNTAAARDWLGAGVSNISDFVVETTDEVVRVAGFASDQAVGIAQGLADDTGKFFSSVGDFFDLTREVPDDEGCVR